MQRKMLPVLLVALLSLSGCSTAAGHDYEDKIFTPGGDYYRGTTAEKVQYGPGSKAVDQAIGGANKTKTPCTEINEPASSLPTSPLDETTNWFFSGDPMDEESTQMTEEDWKTTQKVFKFETSKAISAPRRATHISHYPTSRIFDTTLTNSPATMFNQGVGYTTTYLLEGTTFGNKLPSNKSVFYKVTLENLGRFWCCTQKTQADVQVADGSSFQLFRPDDDILNSEVPQRGNLGFAGRTGLLEETSATDYYVKIKLEYYYGAAADLSPGTDSIKQVRWLPLTFEEFWKLGPKDEAIRSFIFGGSDQFVSSVPEMPTVDPDD